MKSKSTLAILLAFVMILTAMPITGSAADAETYSLSDLFGAEYALTYTWDYAEKTTEKTSVTAPALSSTEQIAYLGNTGDAIEMRLKTDSKVTIDARDNDSHRFNLTIQSSGLTLYTDVSTTTNSTNLTGQWVTLLVVNNGPGYDVYYKFDGATGYSGPLFETTTARTETYDQRSSIWFNGSCYVDYVKRYEQSLASLFADEYAITYTLDVDETNSKPGNLAGPDNGTGYWLSNDGDAMEMRIKAEGNISINTADAAGNRFYMAMNTTGSILYVANGGTDITSSTILTGQWVTLFVVNNGAGYDVYYKLDGDEVKTLLFRSTTSKERTDKNIWFSTVPDNYYVDYVKSYEKLTDLAALFGDDYAVTYSWTNPNKDTVQTSVSAPAMDGDEEGNAYMGETGDAVEMRIKVDNSVTTNAVTIQASDNADERMVLTLNSSGASMYTYDNNTDNLAQSTTVLTGQWVTLLVINNGTGYDVYYKFDGATNYSGPLFETTTSRTGERSNVWFSGSGFYVDYVKKYGPSEGEDGLIVAVSKGSAINSLRAIVSGKSGSLIFAGYDTNDRLVTASVRTVDGTTAVDEEILDTTTLDSSITAVKVFFWNNMTDIIPIARTVRSVTVD